MGALIQAAKEFLQWLFHWWTGPRLEVSFDPSGEPREAIVADADNRTGCFYRLLVTNRGHRTAEECQAFLVAVEPCVAGRSLERPGTALRGPQVGTRSYLRRGSNRARGGAQA